MIDDKGKSDTQEQDRVEGPGKKLGNQLLKPLHDLAKPEGFNPRNELLRAFIDPSLPEEEPPVVIEFSGQPVATLGNFSVITGKAKSRKTFFTTLVLAANAGGQIGCIAIRRETRAAFIDTEQSRYDVQKVQKRIQKMGCNGKATDFFSLRTYRPSERIDMIETFVAENPDIKLIFIDGVRDLVFDINSQEEATMVIGMLMRLTAEFNVHISMILHQNKSNSDVRGHLGTEAVNKAETVIAITKEGNISKVKPLDSRGKDFTPFVFSVDEGGLPYVIEDPVLEIRSENNPKSFDQSEEAHRRRLKKAFKINQNPRYGELVDALGKAFVEEKEKVGINRLKGYLREFSKKGYIKRTGIAGTSESRYEYVPQAKTDELPG